MTAVKLVAIGSLFLTFTGLGFCQQTISISWPTKQLLSQPLTVDQVTSVRITISDVNDVLYQYQGYLTSSPTPLPDVGFDLPKGAALTGCDLIKKTMNDISAASASWQLNPYIDDKGNKVTTPASVALNTTVTYYRENIAKPFSGIDQKVLQSCQSDVQDAYKALDLSNQTWLQRIAKSHTYSFDDTLQPLNDYSIHLKELASDSTHPPQLTSACQQNGTPSDCIVKYTPQNTIISVSGGFLFSELKSPTYVRATVPNSTDALLSVNNTGSINPLLTSLVNVKLPCFWGSGGIPPCSSHDEQFGWALSIGPALSLNSGSSGVSKVGLFGGLSVHLWRYMYITAGMHVGQFPDFPTGFSNGQVIPTSYTGKLDPVSRTSARLAFGITFKGLSIPTSSKSQGTTQGANGTKQ